MPPSVVAIVRTATLLGVDAYLVEVEAELTLGLPFFAVIGLGDTAVHEARYRIQSALRASGFELPQKRITMNLAPAAVRKDGASLDLPMALSLLAAAGHVPLEVFNGALAIGELALTGRIRPVRGALAVAVLARSLGCLKLIVPAENAAEAAPIEGIEVIGVGSLGDVVAHLRGERIERVIPKLQAPVAPHGTDLRDVRGQVIPKRALEVAAAGGHNMILIGNPGSGKTMLARRLPSILPPLVPEEQVEATKIWSAAGLSVGTDHFGWMTARPFRAPHHSISVAGLVGGGPSVKPGEISLAHRGVLFLDEMPEFPKRALDALRQPLEDREITIARARHVVHLPASFMLVGAANPCPCGWLGHASGRCACSFEDARRYLGRISGPLLDRIDIVVEAPPVSKEDLLFERDEESSHVVQVRVSAAREHAQRRGVRHNSLLFGSDLRRFAEVDSKGRALLEASITKLALSARSLDRTLRVARTIADLAHERAVGERAIAEALQYRRALSLSPRAADG